MCNDRENEECKSRDASESEKEEGGGYLLKDQNDNLNNRERENFVAPKK